MSTLTRDRVRSDVEVLSRAGLELEEFLAEAVASLRRAVPWVAACIGTHDPATRILTSARKFGDLVGQDQHDGLFGTIEYDSSEETSYLHMAGHEQLAVGMHLRTHGEVERSERMSRLMVPEFGYADEARLALRQDGAFWGGLALFRGPDDTPFSEDELDYLAGFGSLFAQGVRSGVLTRVAQPVGPVSDLGPAVVVVGAGGEVVQMSPHAGTRLAELRTVAHGSDPIGLISGLVAAARRVARGETTGVPRARARTAGGMWLVLHASPLVGLGDRAGEVVVTIEEARPPEIVSLVVAAFGLTARERDVTALVLQGVDTKEIAATLHVSTYTVQDHLKSVFDKADVRSRRELIARIFFDQYVPRMGTEIAPSGWFAG